MVHQKMLLMQENDFWRKNWGASAYGVLTYRNIQWLARVIENMFSWKIPTGGIYMEGSSKKIEF